MKLSLFRITFTMLLGSALCGIAVADPIEGKITFAGGVTLDTSSAGTATMVTSWVNPSVQSVSGDFSVVPTATLGTVSFNSPWSFNSGAVNNLWSIAVGGFSFDLISSSIAWQDASIGAVVVKGSGTFNGTGLDSYVGSWSFTTQDPSAGDGRASVFSFSSGQSVPDGGTTALMLGVALVGLGLAARRR